MLTPNSLWAPETSRRIHKRIRMACTLTLLSPAHFGSGDSDDTVDLPLLVDAATGKPFIPGPSLAGALRNYLRAYEFGHRKPLPERKSPAATKEAERDTLATCLFGGYKGDDDGQQSALIVQDAFADTPHIELRDGVALNGRSRTAQHGALFSLDTLSAGTKFELELELLISRRKVAAPGKDGETEWRFMTDDELDEHERQLRAGLQTALGGLNGTIRLGARKQRGYGQIMASNWRLAEYDCGNPVDVVSWLKSGSSTLPTVQAGIAALRGAVGADARSEARISLQLSLPSDAALLIRGTTGKDDIGVDAQHIHRHQLEAGVGHSVPVIPGTSWAGALRNRAEAICALKSCPTSLVEGMFGSTLSRDGDPVASRLTVSESVVENAETDLIQNRIRIDRFTGGVMDTALFSEQPSFGRGQTAIELNLTLVFGHGQTVQQRNAEIGLLLHLVKDLWTGDLSIGGGRNVGRGRMRGQGLDLITQAPDGTKKWVIKRAQTAQPNDDRFATGVTCTEGTLEELNAFAGALNDLCTVSQGAN